ncbi:hypothetical protein MJO29_010602 [Puccinia striiformis f. sp. tritici]|uniref:hypothetical protein n=1 Tax=Puccinia striiformis f. sp. tritici TaxID=168172 RepID=UPI002008A800|nr:hypothetical protein Pst134EA_019675 [Puccinia striiformis f. sp. tritici]KAH9459526.1 hypothetical protein Pst134EA_019675 [Puccinia striiformis f. sp. tritici]KAI7948937.1 hypothetical protein MJO29_010602 [Puccinia striiformis f. sp. tritici]
MLLNRFAMSSEPSCDKVMELKLPGDGLTGDHWACRREYVSYGKGSFGAGAACRGNRDKLDDEGALAIAFVD